jgi:nucleotide-binding universal stress UspA family protein
MFSKILVPLDGTPEAAGALPVARTLARATGAAITLLRVTSSDRMTHTQASHKDEHQAAEDDLRLVAEELARDDLQVDWLVRAEPVAESIVGTAQTSNVDVIVMATHGRTGLGRAFLGSVSERVLADSQRPVLLVKPGGQRLEHIATILVPVDGTAGGALGLGAAVGLARATGARLILLDVVPPMPMWMYSDASIGSMVYFDPGWEQEALQSAESYVKGVGERVRTTGLEVETRAVLGDVVQTIHQVADETATDVVVMSTHALTGPARTVLGSVADGVVRTSHRPVLLVRRPGGQPDGLEDAREVAAPAGAT